MPEIWAISSPPPRSFLRELCSPSGMKIRVQSSYDEKKGKPGRIKDRGREIREKKRVYPETQCPWVPTDTETQIEANASAGQARGADEGMTEKSKPRVFEDPTPPQKGLFFFNQAFLEGSLKTNLFLPCLLLSLLNGAWSRNSSLFGRGQFVSLGRDKEQDIARSALEGSVMTFGDKVHHATTLPRNKSSKVSVSGISRSNAQVAASLPSQSPSPGAAAPVRLGPLTPPDKRSLLPPPSCAHVSRPVVLSSWGKFVAWCAPTVNLSSDFSRTWTSVHAFWRRQKVLHAP